MEWVENERGGEGCVSWACSVIVCATCVVYLVWRRCGLYQCIMLCVCVCVCVCACTYFCVSVHMYVQSVLDQTFKVEQLLVDSDFSSPDSLKDMQDILGQPLVCCPHVFWSSSILSLYCGQLDLCFL